MTIEWSLNPKIKLEFKKGIFVSFLQALNSLAAFYKQGSRQLKWGKKKSKGVRYLNPK